MKANKALWVPGYPSIKPDIAPIANATPCVNIFCTIDLIGTARSYFQYPDKNLLSVHTFFCFRYTMYKVLINARLSTVRVINKNKNQRTASPLGMHSRSLKHIRSIMYMQAGHFCPAHRVASSINPAKMAAVPLNRAVHIWIDAFYTSTRNRKWIFYFHWMFRV